jgi:RNA polymerase sigma factor (sigma-70 family)
MNKERSEKPVWIEDCDDPRLVAASLGGDREAFAQIVARYQSLVASLTYSATGSLSQSEDLAQETFLAAWRELGALREPQRLAAWLCGIARRVAAGAVRQARRDPAHKAVPLELAAESPASDALPVERAIHREEEAMLWRCLEQIPESYREPLILFYRQGQSAERVAETLGVSADTVRQRLSRGRKMLEGQLAAFVETTLKRSTPGRSFTLAVMGSLPAQTASIGAASAGGAAAKTAGWLVALNACAGPLAALVANFLGYKMDMASARSEGERRLVKQYYRLLTACIVAPLALIFVAVWARPLSVSHPQFFAALAIAISLSWLPGVAILLVWSNRNLRECDAAGQSGSMSVSGAEVAAAFEYRSRISFLGMPLLHIRFGGSWTSRGRPVRAWIAIGDVAVGGLFAFGGLAVAPVCVGGLTLGGLVFGGFAFGAVVYAGFGLGVWAMGGLVLGYSAIGACAVGWKAAVGAIAVAHEFAQGSAAVALHANDAAADAFTRGEAFFRFSYALLTRWLWPTMIAAILPSFLIWRATRKTRRQVQ